MLDDDEAHSNMKRALGERFALILWGEDEEDGSPLVTVHTGELTVRENAYILQQDEQEIEIRPEWYSRVEPVQNDEDKETLLGADWMLRLTISSIPDDEDATKYEASGFTVHDALYDGRKLK